MLEADATEPGGIQELAASRARSLRAAGMVLKLGNQPPPLRRYARREVLGRTRFARISRVKRTRSSPEASKVPSWLSRGRVRVP
jgi:hypothetical protein